MAATASLEDYIKQFKQDYRKYISSETSSVSSIDTEELLSDFSSETSSNVSQKQPKAPIKSISSLKKRPKSKVSQPSHLKPLHSTPLKMIQEEEEFYDSKYKLSDFMPGKQFDINEYLPRARAEKNKKVQEILANLDVESENMSIISSVDTEFLLQSSDEEEEYKQKYEENGRKISEKKKKPEEKHEFPEKQKKNKVQLTMAKSQVLSVIPRRLSTETLSLSVSSSNKSKKSLSASSPSAFFNSLVPVPKSTKALKLCTCILSGSLYSHYSNCRPVTVSAEVGSFKVLAKKPRLSVLTGVVLIQRTFRRFLDRKHRVNYDIDVDKAARTLNDAFKELEALKYLASERSSEVSRDYSEPQLNFKGINQSYEPSEVDTEELLNSSFSSILSRN